MIIETLCRVFERDPFGFTFGFIVVLGVISGVVVSIIKAFKKPS